MQFGWLKYHWPIVNFGLVVPFDLQLEIVRYLIRAAADIEARDRFLNTPLNDAVRSRSRAY